MQLSLPLTVKIIKDSRSKDAPFVAYATELDAASCGPTETKARENLHEAVQILLEEIDKKGGDHLVYQKEGILRPIIIPKYKQIPEFIILKNLKTAGISREEYFELLKEI